MTMSLVKYKIHTKIPILHYIQTFWAKQVHNSNVNDSATHCMSKMTTTYAKSAYDIWYLRNIILVRQQIFRLCRLEKLGVQLKYLALEMIIVFFPDKVEPILHCFSFEKININPRPFSSLRRSKPPLFPPIHENSKEKREKNREKDT